MSIQGGCLCGEIRYEISGDLQMTGVCHCKNCQKQAGSAFSILFAITNEQLEMNGDLKTYNDTSDSGNDVHRNFCGHCGSPVTTTVPAQAEMTFVKAGTLDDTSILNPDTHYWTKSAQKWVNIDSDATKFEANPS